jgi:hypothetical protein
MVVQFDKAESWLNSVVDTTKPKLSSVFDTAKSVDICYNLFQLPGLPPSPLCELAWPTGP